MSLTTSKPSAWWWYAGLDYNALSQKVAVNALPVQIRPYFDRDAQAVRFTAILASYAQEPTRWWYVGVPQAEIGTLLNQNHAMLYSIAEQPDSNYTLIMEPSSGYSWWNYNVDASQVNSALTQNGASLTWVYGDTKFDTVMRKPGSSYWWWYGQSAAQVGNQLKATGGTLLSLMPIWDNNTNQPHFTILIGPNDGQAFWWYYGITEAELDANLQANNAYLIDIAAYDVWVGPQVFGHYEIRYAVVMRGF